MMLWTTQTHLAGHVFETPALVGYAVIAAAKFTDLSVQITPYEEDGKK
jgi:hypothetical protein